MAKIIGIILVLMLLITALYHSLKPVIDDTIEYLKAQRRVVKR